MYLYEQDNYFFMVISMLNLKTKYIMHNKKDTNDTQIKNEIRYILCKQHT
jgi:hypothetical protein